MKLKIIIISIITVLIFNACQTTKDGIYPSYFDESSATKNFTVKIISEPSGAKVEVNNNYVGKTPLTIKIEGWRDTQTFIRSYTIIAHPIRAGGETQIKYFMGWHQPDKTYGDKIPNTIYFNMNLVRIPEQLNLNINK